MASPDPTPFEELALRQGIITPAQLEECRRLRDKVAADGLPVDVEEILVKKGYVSKAQQSALHGRGTRTVIEGYEILAKLGQGGMGAVYKARQTSLDRVVALKTLLPEFAKDKDGVERFLREAKALAKLNHPNIVAGIDAGESNGHYFYVMEFVDGETLAQALARRKTLPWKEAVAVLKQMGAALEHARAHGLIHRDVKPANILLLKDGSAKLADLGMARFAARSNLNLTRSGQILGTPLYMSPEQSRGDALDIRSDLYSLGITLFETLAGHPPFTGETPLVVLGKQLHDPVPWEILRDVPADLLHVGRKLTEKDRGARYPTPQLLVDDLDALGEGRAVAAAPVAKPKHKTARVPISTKVARKRASPTPFIAGGVAAAALILTLVLIPKRRPPEPPKAEAPKTAAAVDPAEAEAQKAFKAVREFETRNANDVEEVAALYGALRSKAKGTSLEEPVGAAHEMARRRVDDALRLQAEILAGAVTGHLHAGRTADAAAAVEKAAALFKSEAWKHAVARERRRVEAAKPVPLAKPAPAPPPPPSTPPEPVRAPAPKGPSIAEELGAVEAFLERAEKLAARRQYEKIESGVPQVRTDEAKALLARHLAAFRGAGEILRDAAGYLLAREGKDVALETRGAGRGSGTVLGKNGSVLLIGGKTYDVADLTLASALTTAKSARGGAVKPEDAIALAILDGQPLAAEELLKKSPRELPERLERALKAARAEREADAALKAANAAKKDEQTARYSEIVEKFPDSKAAEVARKKLEATAKDVVLWVADLEPGQLYGDWKLVEDEDAAGGKRLTSECKSEVEPLPPSNPSVASLRVSVVPGVAYRLWIRIRTDEVCDDTHANLIYVQATDAVERLTRSPLAPGGPGWVTLRSPVKEGWGWIGRDHENAQMAGALLVFRKAEAYLKIYEGNDAVGFDQVVLSPATWLKEAPVEAHLPRTK